MTQEKTHLVIGLGEVGQAILEVLNALYIVTGIDKDWDAQGKFDFIHICYPFSDLFVKTVTEYQKQYAKQDTVTIIHSSVKVGTTDQIKRAVHSPIRGVHPRLASAIRTCTKFFGCKDESLSNRAMEVFFPICPVRRLSSARSSEALKLWCTTQYGWNIVLEKAIHNYCVMHDVPFDEVYTLSNQTYNEDAPKIGLPNVRRPVLKHMDGPIGGHCVIPNSEILSEQSSIAQMILYFNENLK